MKEYEIFIICVMCTLRNTVSLLLFAYLAVVFGSWWIVLFALLFTDSIKATIDKKKEEKGDKDDK